MILEVAWDRGHGPVAMESEREMATPKTKGVP